MNQVNNFIIITGTTGFVGVNLQKYLKTSHEIESISVRYVPNQQFEIKADAIIHLAGKAHDLKKQKPICLIQSIYCQ